MPSRWSKKAFLAFAAIAIAMIFTFGSTLAQQLTPLIPVDDNTLIEDPDFSGVKGLDLRSHGRQIADVIQHAAQSGNLVVLPSGSGASPVMTNGSLKHDADIGDVQVNDPSIDNIQSFPGFSRPFEESTQSETSAATFGNNILVGYNSSAGEPIIRIGNSLFATQIMLSGYSNSHDGGATWSSHFLPASPGSVFTFGDPSVGVDRGGNFYYASLGADAAGNSAIIVGKSTDGGDTFGPAVVVVLDPGADKEWLAVGPDPKVPGRDNLYVTWTSFQNDGSAQLWMATSLDGGATWTSQLVYAPGNGAVLANQLQFSNPVVDASSGRLYVPFLHFSFFDADDIQVLASNDAGQTFNFLTFNVPGAPDAFSFPNVTPGELVDCGRNNGGLRNVLHQGSDVGGGRFGLARYVHATRLVTQPAAAAFRGRFIIAFQSSTSPFFGDPAAGSEIHILYSQDGGKTFAPPMVVAASTAVDPQHVHPSITLGQNGNTVHVGYYVQQANSQLRTDLARLHVDGNHLKLDGSTGLSTTAFDLTPSNIPFPLATNSKFTTNYDRTIRACYNIGEYMSVANLGNGVVAAWGDNRRSWTSPSTPAPPSPAAGTHPQADVFFRFDDKN